MNTNTQNQIGLVSRSAQLSSSDTTEAQPDTREGRGTLPPIDTEARKKNRTLATPKVLSLLHTQLPAAYRLAEVVGRWVWVTFNEQPAAEMRQQLAQLGFHWNRDRQSWQHPCGQFRLASQTDPHERYSSYYPARVSPGAKPPTTEEGV